MYKAIIFTLISVLSFAAGASTTRQWHFEKYMDFKGGKSQGAMLPSTGGLIPGLRAVKSEISDKIPGLFYTVTRTKNGKIFVGSGDFAAMWRLDGTKLVKIADLKAEVLVTSMTELKNGDLAVATIPNGQIYRISQTGKMKIIAKLPAAHIWALVYDGTWLYAGTGPKSELFRINPDTGKSEKIWDAGQEHILSLAVEKTGYILAGTAPKARLYRIKTGAKATHQLLYDFKGNEVRSIEYKNKKIFVAVNNLTYRATTSYSSNPTSFRTAPPSPAPLVANARMVFQRRKVANGSGSVYTIGDDNEPEILLSLRSGFFTKVQFSGGFIHASDGQSGQIYQINPEDYSGAIMLETEERQVLDYILIDDKQGVAVTGDGAACYRLLRDGKDKVTYESKVMDATRASSFGMFMINVTGGNVEVETRTGTVNDPKDDKLWNPWMKQAGGKLVPGGFTATPIKGPAARFFQFRVTWPAGSKARVNAVKVFFRPANMMPRLMDIVFSGAVGGSGMLRIDPSLLAKPGLRNGDINISWRFYNPDGDMHYFRVFYRRVGEKNWRLLSGKKPVTSTSYKWSALHCPDGIYEVKVEVDDSPSNAGGTALKSSLVSQKLVVDNTAPLLTALRVAGNKLTFSAKDNLSRLTAVSVKIGHHWRIVMPKDGMFDSNNEEFSVDLPTDIKKGTHIVSVRIMDETGNVATFSQEFTR